VWNFGYKSALPNAIAAQVAQLMKKSADGLKTKKWMPCFGGDKNAENRRLKS